MVTFTADAFVQIGEDMRRLADQAAANEREAESILASAETALQLALTPLAHPREVSEACVSRFETAALGQLRRCEAAVAAARHLSVAAREHHRTAHKLAADLRAGTESAGDGAETSSEPRHAVLVVDDFEDTRELISSVLHSAGFSVRTAGNGLEAILAAYEMRPAVIIMDVTMPVLDGLEATRLIKSIDAVRDARIIAYTAQPLPAGPRRDSLFDAVLQKPAPLDLMIQTVRQLVDA